MAPTEHLVWFEDNIDWFGALATESLDQPVPNCPGWTVEHVVNHLTFGLGIGYPIGLRAQPYATEAEVWSDLPLPAELPTGKAAIEAFNRHLTNCLDAFRAVDPDQPCWTYAGAGHARFWFRRAAIETTLHRFDVAGSIGVAPHLADDRLFDAIEETVDFALPLAAGICGATPPAATIALADATGVWSVGSGEPVATIGGQGVAVLDALWGRNLDRITVAGDRAVADAWLSMVSTAFAGR